MTRLETAASILDYLLSVVAASERGIISVELRDGPAGRRTVIMPCDGRQPGGRDRIIDLLVVRDGAGGRCTIIVPCAAFHRPSSAERAKHERLREAGHRVVIARGVAEAELALIRHRCFAKARREAWANRIGQALLAVELPVLRAA